jgi:hypothetical protein
MNEKELVTGKFVPFITFLALPFLSRVVFLHASGAKRPD